MYQAKPILPPARRLHWPPPPFPRPDTTARDVQIEILFCGICHSDLHQARNEWKTVMPTVYPCVPGHDIVGRVTKDQLSSWQQTEHCNEAILSQLLSSF